MPSRDDEARLRILEAYERAKAADPTLTQGEFMMRGAPGSSLVRRDKNGNPIIRNGKTIPAAGHFKSEASAARYFRKIKTGERTGAAMERAGRAPRGNYQFRVRVDDRYISQNVIATGMSSTFDTAFVEAELKGPRRRDVEKIVARYRARYGKEEAAFDPNTMDVRPIRRARVTRYFRLERSGAG